MSCNASPAVRANTLVDAVAAHGHYRGATTPTESDDMQPLAMEFIRAIGQAVGTELRVVDTHSSNPIGEQGGSVVCSLLAEEVREWPYLVSCYGVCPNKQSQLLWGRVVTCDVAVVITAAAVIGNC